MRHVPFVLAVCLYVVILGQNWGVYSAALMLAAYLRNGGRLFSPLEVS